MDIYGKTRPMQNHNYDSYRNVFRVSSRQIAQMNDTDLSDLMGRLFRVQAYLCESPRSQIRVNTEGSAKDDGCDGWTQKPSNPDPWLGSTDTCWQFKVGTAGQPKRLAGEVIKPLPKQTLQNGGRFVVIASGSTNGKKGEDDRLKKLKKEARDNGIPDYNIEVIGSEGIANWCNQHPAVSAHFAGRPIGLRTFQSWANSEEHKVPWQASEDVKAEILARQANLDFITGEIFHLHIQGFPGVGKTRFALELCRSAKWCDYVVYIRQTQGTPLEAIIDHVVQEKDIYLTIVADEAQPEHLSPLREAVGRGNGRVRLITIGHCNTPDITRIPSKKIAPLENDAMREIIRGWHFSMPPEHMEFVARFSDGYVRLARLAADAVVRSPEINTSELLNHDDICVFLDKLIGEGDRRSLYVVAILTHVGWTDDKEEEGRAIAGHFGLDWNAVRYEVNRYHEKLGIVQFGGRYCYISPTPLGIYLAAEAWDIYPELLRKIPDVLPSETARDAYYERLQAMASSPKAREYAREELEFFFRIEDFSDSRAVRRWAALSSADPDKALEKLVGVINHATIEERREIKGVARREIVSKLVHLAWRSASFHDAVKVLALLAEAENEDWANSASNEFVARFLVFLGGTAVPYTERLSVLDDLLEENRPELTKLVIKALAQVGNPCPSRISYPFNIDELQEQEWNPNNDLDITPCIEIAINKLIAIAMLGNSGFQSDLFETAKSISRLFHKPTVLQFVINYFITVFQSYPEERESLRKIVANAILYEKGIRKALSASHLQQLEELHERLVDKSLGAQLLQYLDRTAWQEENGPDLKPLAKKLLDEKQILEEYWPWLTSGEATGAWALGEALAEEDVDGHIIDTLLVLPNPGRDFRLVCGYISVRKQVLGEGWYETWVKDQYKKEHKSLALLFEIVRRCGITQNIITIMIDALQNEQVDSQIMGQFTYGWWHESIEPATLEMLLRAMANNGHQETAIIILEQRLKSNTSEYNLWLPLALDLVKSTELVRNYNTCYHWKEVAKTLAAKYPKDVACVIFEAHADRESEMWFLEHSEAVEALYACIDSDNKGVWQELLPYLQSEDTVYHFYIGFPRGIFDRMPLGDIESWLAESPENNASIAARLVSMDFTSDDTLISRVIGQYGDNENVANAFLSAYRTGAWIGPASIHWDELAKALDEVAGRTSLPKLRRWATSSSRILRDMASQDWEREQEENLRWK
jgi:hypothetical protein